MADPKQKQVNNSNATSAATPNANDLAKPHATQNRSTHTELDQPATDDVERDEELLDEADDAVTDMQARERRRDSTYRTSGDDHSAGIDTNMDANAPKQNEQQGRHQQDR